MFAGLSSLGGVGDIVAYIGVAGDKQFVAKLKAMDAQVTSAAKSMD